MRRILLPLLICTLWLASLAGAQWMRVMCVQECATHARAQVHEEGCHCQHERKSECSKCEQLSKASLVLNQSPDAPLFFACTPVCIESATVHTRAPLFEVSREWQWSLPPPDTLLTLHCQLMI